MKFAAALLAMVAACASAHARPWQITATQPTTAAGYVGPGDLVSSSTLFFTGLRAFSAAVAATHANAVQLCTAADAACEIETLATDGTLALGAVGATCNNIATICTIKNFYDQVGGLTGAIQDAATLTQRAIFVINCQGALPCARTTGATKQGYLFSTLGGSTNQPYTYSWVGQRTGLFTTLTGILSTVNGGVTGSLRGNSVASAWIQLAGVNGNVTVSDSVFHSVLAVFNGTPSVARVDTTETTFGSTFTGHTNGYGTTLGLFRDANTTTVRPGSYDFFEAGIWTLAMDATQRANVNANSKTYWGF